MADKFIDKVKFFMGLDSDDEPQENAPQPVEELPSIEPAEFQRPIERPKSRPSIPFQEPKVIPLNHDNAKVNVTILKPAEFNDAATVVNNLKLQKPVIVNLESLDHDEARKIFDFCSGALYALSGKMFKVSRNIFLMAPENVDISGNLRDAVDKEYEME